MFMAKTLRKLEREGKALNLIKNIYRVPGPAAHLMVEGQSVPLKSRNNLSILNTDILATERDKKRK